MGMESWLLLALPPQGKLITAQQGTILHIHTHPTHCIPPCELTHAHVHPLPPPPLHQHYINPQSVKELTGGGVKIKLAAQAPSLEIPSEVIAEHTISQPRALIQAPSTTTKRGPVSVKKDDSGLIVQGELDNLLANFSGLVDIRPPVKPAESGQDFYRTIPFQVPSRAWVDLWAFDVWALDVWTRQGMS